MQSARLIPTSGINGPDEAERRATSALLAVMMSVREFGTGMVRPLGAPAGQIDAFIEVPFAISEDQVVQPDGLIHVSRGKTSWVCLVEVKTGAGELRRDQVENYLDVARAQGFDAVLTISNQLSPAVGIHPVEVDKRKLRKVGLFHLSWAEIVTLAIQTRVHRGVSDPDQAWILGELIRYLEHPKSGAIDFTDMGGNWVTVRESILAGTLRKGDKGLPEVASKWDQLLRFAAMRLSRELGADVQSFANRKEQLDPQIRLGRFASELVDTGTLTGSLKIPDAIGMIEICVDVRASKVTVSLDVDAPQEGRLLTRVSWLLRQLVDAPDQLRVDGYFVGSRSTTSELLAVVREDPSKLLDDQKRDFRAFRIAATSPMGIKRGVGRGAFIDSVLASVDGFYEGVVQGIRPWTARAPQLPAAGRSAVEEAGIDTTPPPSDIGEVPAKAPGEIRWVDGLAPVATDVIATWGKSRGDTEDDNQKADVGLVSWDAAADRLDRERAHDEPVPNGD